MKKKFKEEFELQYQKITSNLICDVLDFWNTARGGRFAKVDAFLKQIFADKNYTPDISVNGQADKYVYLRCYLVDSIYSTQLKEGFNSMVINLSDAEVTKKILDGDISVIDDIKTVNSTKTGTKEALSFASKYCYRMNPTKFAIYDSVVRDMLKLINKKENFAHCDVSSKYLEKNYPNYKGVIDDFILKYGHLFPNKNCDYDLADRFLWTWGKMLEGMK